MKHEPTRVPAALPVSTLAAIVVVCVLAGPLSHGQSDDDFEQIVDLDSTTDYQRNQIEEHVYGGLPSLENLYVRRGYVLSFNSEARTPNWVAYHVTPDYRNTPSRKGAFSSFRADPFIDGEMRDADYVGLFSSRGYARGHLAPYAVMGGDRDGDGDLAEYHEDDTSNLGDPDDAETIKQANYMSNIAPQHHEGFNGWERTVDGRVDGLWYELERWVQDTLVVEGEEAVWVFAGCIFGPGPHETVGNDNRAQVPPMFFKIVILENPDGDVPIVLAYLLPHQRKRHGELDAFLVSIDVIEALTGLDFFHALDLTADEQFRLEDTDTWNNAVAFFE